MKRASAGGLILAILLVIGLGLAGSLIPLKECAGCSGLSHFLHSLQSPSIPPIPPPRIGCPDCADRGQVSLFRSWIGPRVAPAVAAIPHEIVHQERAGFYRPLADLVVADGKDALAFLQTYEGSAILQNIRFIDSEGETFLVLLLDASLRGTPSLTATVALLLSLEGRALDSVRVSCLGEESESRARIVPYPYSGQELIVIDSKMSARPLSVRVDQWQREPQDLMFTGDSGNEICGLSIKGRRFVVRLAPQK